MSRSDPLENCIGFDWDEDNSLKIWDRHRVTPEEAEDVFFGLPLVLRSDVHHSNTEKRHYVLGQTRVGRPMFVAFAARRKLIRVISARDMNRREREAYSRHDEKGTA